MKTLTLNQGTPEWKAWRSGAWIDGKRVGGRVGASDLVGILNLPVPWENPPTRATIFAEKVHGTERPATWPMRNGNLREAAARDAYLTRHPAACKVVCVESVEVPWMGASLDGLCGAVESGQWILELKVPSFQAHDYALNGIVPDYCVPQVQWQLLVTGLTRCDFASFNPGERFTPANWPLRRTWEALPKGTREHPRPSLLDLWLALPPADRPPQPAEWLAVVPVTADPARQGELMEEAARFWFEVEEARAGWR